ncbi:nucleotide-binding oligomerization domain-containing protein 2-like isoform X2 [Colossoma macropomum]|uniref:nucleotide-binding oligomerization domain-containing protein 2-like isoform X2 n=1 Tax=Colossoma macropomum TaxID=42526 RepID=UPI0018653AD1|nr:nucleotide-binding oligomerization domain-containing protein 2-like isoform X2 [Colossoma macropomum]
MDPSELQAPDLEAVKKGTNPEMVCSKSRGRNHQKAEKKDSGFGSDRSVSPQSRAGSVEKKSMSKPDSDKGEHRDNRSEKINTHRKLERTPSVPWTVNSPFQDSRPQSTRADSLVSGCQSMRSNISKRHPPGFTAALSGHDEESADSEEDSFDSMETFPGLKDDHPSSDSSSSNHSDSEQPTECVIPEPSDVSILNETKKKLKERYKEQLKYISVKAEKHRSPILLNDVYTEPYITQEEEEEEGSPAHEIGEPKAMSMRVRLEELPVKWNIFEQPPEQRKHIKTMLTKGIAGIGKTICLQKFILDWAEGKTNQEIDLMLALSLQNLNLKKKENVSLTELLHHFFPEVKQIDLNTVRIMLIFDGLDEYHLPLDFQHNTNWCDPNKPTAVDVLLTNLIKGNLLPSALLWVTSRPRAAIAIPSEYIQKVTEIHGFTEAQKEEYFHKRISDKTKASRIISHINTTMSFQRMSHIPAYCSLSAAVLQDTLDDTNAPQTLTQMLTCLLQADLQ